VKLLERIEENARPGRGQARRAHQGIHRMRMCARRACPPPIARYQRSFRASRGKLFFWKERRSSSRDRRKERGLAMVRDEDLIRIGK